MTREQFMERLIWLLRDIPEKEREEAISYFENYFEEAGESEEAHVIGKLGSPDRVAALVRANLEESNAEYGEYSEKGYEDARMPEHTQVPEVVKKKRTNSTILLAIIALVFLAPLIKGLFKGVLGILVTILLLPFLLVFGLGVAAVGLIIGGLACAAASIPLFFTALPAGILTLGVGFLLAALGIMSALLVLRVGGRLLPGVIRKGIDCFKGIIRRKDGAGK